MRGGHFDLPQRTFLAGSNRNVADGVPGADIACDSLTNSGYVRQVLRKERFPSADSGKALQHARVAVGVIVVGAALIEAALIPGMIVGAAAVLAPKYVPKMGETLQPMFRSFVRGAYKFGRKAREAAAEAKEQVQDIVAEVHAEGSASPDAAGTPKA